MPLHDILRFVEVKSSKMDGRFVIRFVLTPKRYILDDPSTRSCNTKKRRNPKPRRSKSSRAVVVVVPPGHRQACVFLFETQKRRTLACRRLPRLWEDLLSATRAATMPKEEGAPPSVYHHHHKRGACRCFSMNDHHLFLHGWFDSKEGREDTTSSSSQSSSICVVSR